ncbi:MAG: ankyrin repeat domain-containing protein [Candidatus Babeliales bacterium]
MNKKYILALASILLIETGSVLAMEKPAQPSKKSETISKEIIDRMVQAIDQDNADKLAKVLDEYPGLLKMKFDPHLTNALFIAADRGAVNTGKLLLKKGVDRNQVNQSGANVMDIAALNNKVPFLQLLIDEGFDVNKLNANGQAPLYQAIAFDNVEATDFLLKHGAKTGPISMKQGQFSLLSSAVFYGAEHVVKLLIEKYKNDVNAKTFIAGVEITPNDLAVMNSQWRIAQYLKEHGADSTSHYQHMKITVRNKP